MLIKHFDTLIIRGNLKVKFYYNRIFTVIPQGALEQSGAPGISCLPLGENTIVPS